MHVLDNALWHALNGPHATLAERVALAARYRPEGSARPRRDTQSDPASDDHRVLRLGAADVPEMLALVKRTDPGPFLTRTVELGTYLGIRHEGPLIAMAGERARPPGFTEISPVCTDPAHRGRGLASKLVQTLVAAMRARGDTPFLHLTLENEPAHRVYSALGFETRTFLDVVGVRAPV